MLSPWRQRAIARTRVPSVASSRACVTELLSGSSRPRVAIGWFCQRQPSSDRRSLQPLDVATSESNPEPWGATTNGRAPPGPDQDRRTGDQRPTVLGCDNAPISSTSNPVAERGDGSRQSKVALTRRSGMPSVRIHPHRYR